MEVLEHRTSSSCCMVVASLDDIDANSVSIAANCCLHSRS